MLKLVSLTKNKYFWHIPSKPTIGGVIQTHHVHAITMPHLVQEQKHFSGVKQASQGLAPITKEFANSNFGGAVFDRLAYSGGVVMINVTAVK